MKNDLFANVDAEIRSVEVAQVVVPQVPQLSLFGSLEIPEDAFSSIRMRRKAAPRRKTRDDSGIVVRGFAAYLMKQGRRNKYTPRVKEVSKNDLEWSDSAIVKLHRALLEDCERNYKKSSVKNKFSYLSWMLGDPRQEYSFYSCLVMEGINPNIAIDAVEATAPQWFKHIVESNMPYEDIPAYLATVEEEEIEEADDCEAEDDEAEDFASMNWSRPVSLMDVDDEEAADPTAGIAEFENRHVMMA